MLASKKTKRGVIGAVVLAGVLAVSGFALTNALVVSDLSNAGDGLATISTVTVADNSIDYTLNATNPALVDTADFVVDVTTGGALTPNLLATSEVWVQLVSAAAVIAGGSTAGDWIGGTDCAITGAPDATAVPVSCDLTGTSATSPVAVVDINQFRVVIAD